MPAGTNPALIIGGPAVIVGRGKSFFSKQDIVLEPNLATFDIEVSTIGVAQQREDFFTYTARFTPTGKLSDLAAYYPFANRNVGELMHLVETMGAVSATGDTVTVTSHRFRAGHGVRVASFGTLPAGLSASTQYYIGVVDADTVSFHTTEANAIALTSPVNITDAGTGTHKIIEQEALTIWSINEGRGITFWNAIITQQPSLDLAGNRTAFGEIGFEFFRKHATAPTAANSMYTEITSAPTYTAYDPSNDVTQPYTAAWGGSAPWDSFITRDGFRATFGIQSEPVPDDAVGLISRRITSRSAELVASPRGIDETALRAKLLAQDSGAGRGRALTGNNLDVQASGLFLRLYKASISRAPELYGRAADRLGDITWRANIGVTGGAADPLFYIGTSALT